MVLLPFITINYVYDTYNNDMAILLLFSDVFIQLHRHINMFSSLF